MVGNKLVVEVLEVLDDTALVLVVTELTTFHAQVVFLDRADIIVIGL